MRVAPHQYESYEAVARQHPTRGPANKHKTSGAVAHPYTTRSIGAEILRYSYGVCFPFTARTRWLLPAAPHPLLRFADVMNTMIYARCPMAAMMPETRLPSVDARLTTFNNAAQSIGPGHTTSNGRVEMVRNSAGAREGGKYVIAVVTDFALAFCLLLLYEIESGSNVISLLRYPPCSQHACYLRFNKITRFARTTTRRDIVYKRWWNCHGCGVPCICIRPKAGKPGFSAASSTLIRKGAEISLRCNNVGIYLFAVTDDFWFWIASTGDPELLKRW